MLRILKRGVEATGNLSRVEAVGDRPIQTLKRDAEEWSLSGAHTRQKEFQC